MERQRLIIGNLTQYGMVEELDAMDLPPNAFQLLSDFAFYKGRLGAAKRWGAVSSATPIFNGTNYACCGLWELYNSGILKLKAGQFAEYENAAGTMYEIPCWLGMYGTVVNSTGVTTGNALDAGWTTTTFPRAPNKWLTTNDKVFTAPLATPELGENFTDLTTAYAIAVTGITVSPTAGATYHVDGAPTPIYTVISTSLTGSAPNIAGTLYINGASAPAASSHIDKDTGTGDAAITYTYTAANNVVRLNTYTEWSDSANAILQSNTITTYADTAYNATTTEGLAFNSGAIGHITNQFFTIRKIKLLGEGANASLIVRDNTTKRGYALQVEQTATPGSCWTFRVSRNYWTTPPAAGDVYTRPNGTEFTIVGHAVSATGTLQIYTEGTGDPQLSLITENAISRKAGYSGGQPSYWVANTALNTGPFTVTIRLWDGYFDSADSAVGVNASVVWEKTAIYDWGYSVYNDVYHEDLWMWWRDNFVTFGYGPNAIGCMTTSATPATPRVGFALRNAYIAAASSGKNCIYSIDVAAGKTGPYAVSAVAATTLTLTSPPADGDYLIWGCKYASRKKVVTASDYVLFVTDNTSSANFPATIWRGGMTEEVPLTNPTYAVDFAYAANDIAIYKGRVFLGGAHRMILKPSGSSGYSWAVGLNSPTLVKWSCPYKPDVWEDSYPSGTTGSEYYLTGHIDFAETNGAVNAIGQLRDILVVYKSDAIAMLSPTGVYSDPFQVDYMAWKVGVNEPRAIGISPETHLFPTPDELWQVQIGEVSKTPARYSVGQYGKVWMLPGENTVFMQAYFFGDIDNLCLAYNYSKNAMYYAFLKNLMDLVEQKDSVYGITAAGLYIYQTRETNSIVASYNSSPRAITAVLSMGDLLNSKTIYNVDVFTRARNTGVAPTAASLDIRVTVDNTAESAYTTVTGQIVGKEQPGFALVANPVNETNLWRFRYNKILTGLTFQIDFMLNASYLTHEIVRIEVDYEPHGLSKQA